MNELITGYNVLHLKNFNAAELDALAQVLPKGLTYRCYGGGNVTPFVMDSDLSDFIKRVEGSAVLTWTKKNSATWLNPYGQYVNYFQQAVDLCEQNNIPIKAVQWQNELYLFDAPTWRDGWRKWFDYNFRKAKYYRELAIDHITDFMDFIGPYNEVINLPLKVNQNAGYKAYAKRWLESGADFDISLHVYGVPAHILRDNLKWYRENTNRKIHIYEFNGKKNERNTYPIKNDEIHAIFHHAQLVIIEQELGDQLGDILYFCLAGNDTTAGWEEPSFLHKYQLTPDNEVINTVSNVWPD